MADRPRRRIDVVQRALVAMVIVGLTVTAAPVAQARAAADAVAPSAAAEDPQAAQDRAGTTSCASTTVVEPARGADLTAASLPDDALDDLRRSAEQEDITLGQAVERYAWHDAVAQVVAELRDTHPDQYAGARIEDDGAARAWVGFAGAAPEGAVDVVRGAPVPIAVREHCGHTEADLKERLEEVHYEILARRDVVADVSSAYDIDTGAVTVLVEPAQAGSAALRSSLGADLAADLPGPASVPVDVQVVADARTSDDITIYGGRALSSCTTGFNVAGGGYRGTTTAGHCGNGLSYSGLALTFMREHQGRYGDLQWHRRAGETFTNQFDSGNSIRGVFSTGAAVENLRLCRNGKTTGYHCDDVYQLNHCNGSRCGLVAMDNRYASDGDSGGPWFYNNRAYGIHQGGKWWNFGYRDLYTPVVYLPSALGVSVVTS